MDVGKINVLCLIGQNGLELVGLTDTGSEAT